MEHVLTMTNLKLKPSLFTPRPISYDVIPSPFPGGLYLQFNIFPTIFFS